MMNRKKAFTLTEVIIVLVILGALALILVPNMSRMMPDNHNIRYKKAFYTIQEIVNDIVNDPSVCQGLVNTTNIAGNPSNWVNANSPDEILTMCYVLQNGGDFNRDRNFAQEVCDRLSTTAECSTANIPNIDNVNSGATGVLTTNNMRWNLAPNGGQTLSSHNANNGNFSYTIYVDVDGCGNNNTFNDNCVGANPNANDGVYRITIRSDGKVFPGTAAAGEDEDNLLLNDPTN